MGLNGFDSRFSIRRKRNIYALQFLMYLDGLESAAGSWPDKEDTDIDPTASGLRVAPFGYISEAGAITGNLGVNGDTITGFSIGAVITRDALSNNEGVFYGLFGSTHYPRVYFVGTTLHAEVKLDGNVKSISIANVNTFLKVGQPFFLVFRGSAATGIEIIIDGVSRGTQTDTGTAFDTGSGNFKLCTDTNLSYNQKGSLRGMFAIAQRLTDTQLTVWRNMLDYEGYFDIWHDDFEKWNGITSTFSSGANFIGSSAYVGTIVES